MVDAAEYENQLNSLGNSGWELVSSFTISRIQSETKEIVSVFKRRR
ncbi:DUF4177 domain-containing protein [Paenibacillus alba]